MHVLLGADVLVLLRLARHFADADSVLDVSELQAQVLASDGQHGAPLPGSRLWMQLEVGGQKNEVGTGVSQNPIVDLLAKAAAVHHMEYNARHKKEGLPKSLRSTGPSPPGRITHSLPHYRPMKNDLRSINSSSNSVKHPQPAKRRHLTRSRP